MSNNIEKFLVDNSFVIVEDREQLTYQKDVNNFKFFEVTFCDDDVIDFVYELETDDDYSECSLKNATITDFVTTFNRIVNSM